VLKKWSGLSRNEGFVDCTENAKAPTGKKEHAKKNRVKAEIDMIVVACAGVALYESIRRLRSLLL
jgi:hypothetical protein